MSAAATSSAPVESLPDAAQNVAFRLAESIQHHQAGRHRDAESGYRRVLDLKPGNIVALSNLGLLLNTLGRHDEAIAACRGALEVDPHHTNAHVNLGESLRCARQFAAAAQAYRDAVALGRGEAGLRTNLGIVLCELGKLDEALIVFQEAERIEPGHATALANVALVLFRLKRFSEAEVWFRRAFAIEPESSDIASSLGSTLLGLEQFEEALAMFERARELDPGSALAHFNRGRALLDLDRLDASIAAYEQAVALAPGAPEMHVGLGEALLTAGDFERGWSAYEWRWKSKAKEGSPYHRLGGTIWQGEDIAGKTLFLHSEQGFGDTIQFIRHVPEVVARGAKVVLAIQPALRRLVGDMEGVVTAGPEHDFDLRCSLYSLPRLLEKTRDSFAERVPYLAAEPARIRHWAERLPRGKLLIGVAWQGNPEGDVDKGRSIPLRHFEALARIPGVCLVSLQKKDGLEQLEAFPDDLSILRLGEGFDTGPDAFLDTAAVMMNLDLVITSDTSIAHLAGALGRPVWIALKLVPDWRWMLRTERSLWYPSARLFRQQRRDDWSDVFQRIAQRVAAKSDAASGSPEPTSQAEDASVPGTAMVPVSFGELIDKITILEIKAARIDDHLKVRNVMLELEHLMHALRPFHGLLAKADAIRKRLSGVNETLWTIEDEIRELERVETFNNDFIELARAVYKNNDERARLKRQLNDLSGSTLIEEKSYRQYQKP